MLTPVLIHSPCLLSVLVFCPIIFYRYQAFSNITSIRYVAPRAVGDWKVIADLCHVQVEVYRDTVCQ